MSEAFSCSFCRRIRIIRAETNGHGVVREVLDPCSCIESRRKREGLCVRCGVKPIQAGRPGRAKYCTRCRDLVQAAQLKASQERHRAGRRIRERERYATDELYRERKKSRRRAEHSAKRQVQSPDASGATL